MLANLVGQNDCIIEMHWGFLQYESEYQIHLVRKILPGIKSLFFRYFLKAAKFFAGCFVYNEQSPA